MSEKLDENLEDFDEIESAETELRNAIVQLNAESEAQVKIYRCLKGKEIEYLTTVHPTDFDLDMLRDEFDGGRFRIYVYRDVDGSLKQVTNRVVNVAAPKKNPEIVAPIQQKQDDSTTHMLLMKMAEMQQQSNDKFMQIMLANKPEPVDMLGIIATASKLFEKQQAPQTNPAEMFEIFQQGLNLGKDLGGGSQEKETGTLDVLNSAIQSFGPAIAQAMATQPQPVTKQQQTPQIQQKTTEDEMNFQQKLAINYILAKAQNNADPALQAEFVVDNLPIEFLEPLLQNPDPISELAKLDPRFDLYRPWFAEMFKHIREILSESPEDELTSGADFDTTEES